MATAIRKHLRDFIAVAVLIVVAAGISYYIFQEQRLRIPILEEKPFELKAEFETAQAVVPGQGQTIRVAGVRVGDVMEVEVENGVGVVTFAIDREYLPIYRDATLLMRPMTGLKDMFFQLDPGSKAAGEYEEGDVVPVSNTAPDVNLDEILDALDADTQAYLRLLLVGAGKGLEGRDKELGELLGGLGPINENLKRLSSEVASRQQNMRNLIHNFRTLTGRIGQADEDLVELVTTSNTALGAIAEQDPSVRRGVELLGPTLQQAEETLTEVAGLAAVMGPAFDDLRPFARNLDEANLSLAELSRSSTPVLKNEIRPFVRSAREPIPDLRRAAARFSTASPRLTVIGKKLNKLGNMAAYNPRGAEDCPGDVCGPNRDEGYLYWAGWLGHNGNLVFNTADGNGPFRRIYFTAGCSQLQNIITGEAGTEENPKNPQATPAPDEPGETPGEAFEQFIRERITGIVTGLGSTVSPTGACPP
jgi:phospholipid/cholesterol/gamma-HCH transport system substrate-binding protein